ncbi:DUF4309 domain-containing protein [Salinithrix halophila]|uniref:DUF4309 domain-containing protein n=1 Tax=Salinithrix halophila TaxID=1485204 RepID=A0ABV8JA90_9BACL
MDRKAKFLPVSVLSLSLLLGAGTFTAPTQADAAQAYATAKAVTASAKASTGHSAVAKTTQKSHNEVVDEAVKLARKGKVRGSEFVVGKTLIDEVYEKWGDPNYPAEPDFPYDRYIPGMMHGEFFVAAGRGDVVYDIQVTGPQAVDHPLQEVTKAELIKQLGKPNKVTKDPFTGEKVLTYHPYKDKKPGKYELRFILSKKDNKHVSRVSVYSPEAAKPMGAD